MLAPAVALIVLAATACNRELAPDPPRPAGSGHAFPTEIRVPDRLRGVVASGADAQNLRLPCVSCHSLRGPQPLPASEAALTGFHKGLTFRHGELSCASCHAPAAPAERLRLADSREIPVADALSLCSQCHGTQRRDYDHGAHGGMRGYWDLTRGPRERNSCVDCHDPHAPRYVGGLPVHSPRDRFLGGGHG